MTGNHMINRYHKPARRNVIINQGQAADGKAKSLSRRLKRKPAAAHDKLSRQRNVSSRVVAPRFPILGHSDVMDQRGA